MRTPAGHGVTELLGNADEAAMMTTDGRLAAVAGVRRDRWLTDGSPLTAELASRPAERPRFTWVCPDGRCHAIRTTKLMSDALVTVRESPAPYRLSPRRSRSAHPFGPRPHQRNRRCAHVEPADRGNSRRTHLGQTGLPPRRVAASQGRGRGIDPGRAAPPARRSPASQWSASVDRDVLATDVVGQRRAEKQHGIGHILR